MRAEEIATARALVDSAGVVVVGTRSTRVFADQAEFVATLAGWGKPVVAIALNEPYDADTYPTVPTALAIYGAEPAMLAALTAVLAGDTPARGRLPRDEAAR